MKIGFLGLGRMGTPVMNSVQSLGAQAEIYVYDPQISEENGYILAKNEVELVCECQIVFCCVLPHILRGILPKLADVCENKCFVSIAAGVNITYLQEKLPGARVVRIMPNTPMRIGAGVVAICEESTANADEMALIERALSSKAMLVHVPEANISVVTAISGSGPAYVYMFIEALAFAGIREGLEPEAAYALAEQTVLGSAQMAITAGDHPAVLKDNVTTPGGTTAAALFAMEDAGFRSAVIKGVRANIEKQKSV